MQSGDNLKLHTPTNNSKGQSNDKSMKTTIKTIIPESILPHIYSQFNTCETNHA